jgi:hypothetical protein
MLALPGTRQIVINQAFKQWGSTRNLVVPKLQQYWNIYIISNEQVMTTANYQSKSCTRYLEIKLTMSRETSND